MDCQDGNVEKFRGEILFVLETHPIGACDFQVFVVVPTEWTVASRESDAVQWIGDGKSDVVVASSKHLVDDVNSIVQFGLEVEALGRRVR